ncbi:unnamed protein product [Closterium sp. Naga37s-1]|nr:unnamed protein product [Closterium sp. Naga37s-1]
MAATWCTIRRARLLTWPMHQDGVHFHYTHPHPSAPLSTPPHISPPQEFLEANSIRLVSYDHAGYARATPTQSAHCSQPSITYPSTPPSSPLPTRPHPSPPVPPFPTRPHPSPPSQPISTPGVPGSQWHSPGELRPPGVWPSYPNPKRTLQSDVWDAGEVGTGVGLGRGSVLSQPPWGLTWHWGRSVTCRTCECRVGVRYLTHR